jgi:hypothetical protein
MDDHDHCHYQGQDMHEVVRRLEDERVCDLNRSRVTVCLYAGATVDLLLAHQRAQWYRRLCAYRRKVAETHLCGLLGVVWCRSGCGWVRLCTTRKPLTTETGGDVCDGTLDKREKSECDGE